MSTDVTSAGTIAGEEIVTDDGVTIVIAHENPPHDGVDTTITPINSIQCPQPSCSRDLIYNEHRAHAALNYIHCANKACSRGLGKKTLFCYHCKIAYCRHIVPDTVFDQYRLRMGLSQLLERLEDIATSRSGLDIYQACAILKVLDSVGDLSRARFGISILAPITAIVQVLGCCMFIIQLINDRRELSDKFCDPTHSFFKKVLAASLVITVVGTVQFSSIMAHSKQGLYPLVNSVYRTRYSYIADRMATRSMVMFGYIVNYLCMTLTMIGSSVIVYTADSVSNLLLNSAALLFLVEIDDYFVPFWVYYKLESFVKCFKDDIRQMDGRAVRRIEDPESAFDSLDKNRKWQCRAYGTPRISNVQELLNAKDDARSDMDVDCKELYHSAMNSHCCSRVFLKLLKVVEVLHTVLFFSSLFGMPILLFVCY